MQEEIWKTVVGFNDYEISNKGRCRSIERIKFFKRKDCGFYIKYKSKILKPVDDTKGYLSYKLYKDKKQYTIKAHRLVAIAFIDNPKNKKEVNHIDRNKYNNSSLNLEWVTPKENVNHYRKSILLEKV